MMPNRALSLLAGAALLTTAFIGCGGDDDDPNAAGERTVATTEGGGSPARTATQAPQKPPPSTAGVAGGPEPVLPEPAALYTLQLTDLPADLFEPIPPNTGVIGIERFELLGQFTSGLFAAANVREWNYVEGWSVEYAPLGRLSALVDGGYYVNVDSYLFSEATGAHEAYESFIAQYKGLPGSVEEEALPLGNESASYSVIQGTVGNTETPLMYHRFIFRRGNLIGIVQTTGAEPYMAIDLARDYAVIIDSKALGDIAPELPTPFPTPGG